VSLLARDLALSHGNLAIRHYCMLCAIGARLPDAVRRSCEALVDRCPEKRLARIVRDVENWLRWCDAEARGPQQAAMGAATAMGVADVTASALTATGRDALRPRAHQ
jgi:hypothetical protein